ncbi:MAG: hypothetical protein SNH27_12615 [Rikenellaceae bacterium]
MECINEYITNREIATAIWVVFYIVFLCCKNRSFFTSFADVITAIGKAICALLLLVIAPTLLTMLILSTFITMDFEIYKTLLIWMITTNLLAHSFSLNNVDDKKSLFSYFWKTLLTIPIIWYVVDFTSFSLLAEMLIIPALFFINGMYNIDYINLPENASVKRIVCFLYIGMYVFWGYTFYMSITDVEFNTRANLEQFISIPVATFMYMILSYPMILILKYHTLYDSVNTVISDSIKKESKNKIYLFCKGDIKKLTYLTDYIMRSKHHNSKTLSRAISNAIICYEKE